MREDGKGVEGRGCRSREGREGGGDGLGEEGRERKGGEEGGKGGWGVEGGASGRRRGESH